MVNEEEFVDDFMRVNLPLVDKMVVAEGAVVGNPFCTPDGHSVDNTLTLLEKYRDLHPDKVVLVTKEGKWNSKQEQKNATLEHINEGEWWFGIGADEFYMPQARKQIESLHEKYPEITEYIFPMIHFWNDTNHIVVDETTRSHRALQRHQRLFKYQGFMFFVNHPTINDRENRDIFFNQDYEMNRMILGALVGFKHTPYAVNNYNEKEEITMFHYSFIRNRLHQIKKHIFYLMRDQDYTFEEAVDFISKVTHNDIETIYGYIEQIHNKSKLQIKEYDVAHPLQNKVFEDEIIDLDALRCSVGNFLEMPEK